MVMRVLAKVIDNGDEGIAEVIHNGDEG